jgi:hypothetical protein
LKRASALLTLTLERATWADLAWLACGLAAGGAGAALAGVYAPFIAVVLVGLSVVAARSTPAACVLVALTSPVVALGSLDVGFHLLPCYVLAIAGLGGALWRREWTRLAFTTADRLLVGFVVVAAVITVANLGTAPATSVVGATGANAREVRSFAQLAALALMVGIYLLMRMGLREWRGVDAVLRSLFVAMALVGAYALYQAVGREVGLPFTYVNERRAASTLPIQEDVYIRMNSTLPEASPLAQFMAIGLFVGLAALTLPGGRPPWLRGRAAWVLPLGAGGIVVATLSKSAWLACALWLPALLGFAWGRRRLLRTLTVAVTVAALAVVGIMSARGGVSESAETERYVRVGYWIAAVQMVGDQPLGVGVGNFAFYYPLYSPMSTRYEYLTGVADAHNVVLDMAVETGVIGAVLFAAFLVAVIAGGVQAVGRARGDPQRALAIGAVLAFGVGATMHLTYSYFYYPFEWVLAGACAAFPHLLRPAERPGSAPEAVAPQPA